MTLGEFVDYINKAGVIGLLALAIVSGKLGWWVWKRELEVATKDRDEWKRLALSGTVIAERAVEAFRRGGSDYSPPSVPTLPPDVQ